jgi:hypothetical protein
MYFHFPLIFKDCDGFTISAPFEAFFLCRKLGRQPSDHLVKSTCPNFPQLGQGSMY